MSNRFSAYPATLTANSTPIHFRQMDSYGFSPNATKSPYTPPGALDVAHVGLAKAMPVHRFSTLDLTTALTNVSIVAGLDVDGGAVFRYQQRLCQSTFDTAAVHISRAANAGLLIPRSIAASSDDAAGARINLELFSISSNGIASPETKTASVDLSAVSTPTFTSRFFFGPVYLSGSKIEGIERVNIDFGLNAQAKTFDLVYPTCYTIDTRGPTITFTGTNAGIDAALNSFINDLGGTLAVYFRKGVHGQARVADATAQHIKISTTSGEYSVSDEAVQSNEDGSFSFSVIPTASLALSLSSAIGA